MSEGYIKNGKYIKTSGNTFKGFKPYKMYGGRHLTDVLELETDAECITWLCANSADPDAWQSAGIMIGDYVTVNVGDYGSHNIVIAHCLEKANQFNVNPMLILTTADELVHSVAWYTDTVPDSPVYKNSNLQIVTSSLSTDIIASGFTSLKTSINITEGNSQIAINGVMCPTERMVFGCNVYADSNDTTTSVSYNALNNLYPVHLDYYRLCPENLRINTFWWLSNVANKITSGKYACLVGSMGQISNSLCTSKLSIRPIFFI